MSDNKIAFIIGNGKSRQAIDLSSLVGKGTIFGTFIGVLIIGSLESGIIALGLSGFYVQFINGIMITVAVTVYALIQRKKT